MGFLERMGLPEWMAWFVPVVILLIVSSAWSMYIVKRELNKRSAVAQRQEEVRASGDSAIATVLETTDTGVRTGADEYFVWRLRLSVRPIIGAPFLATIEVPVAPTRFADFGEGREIRVKVGPDGREVIVDQRTR